MIFCFLFFLFLTPFKMFNQIIENKMWHFELKFQIDRSRRTRFCRALYCVIRHDRHEPTNACIWSSEHICRLLHEPIEE